MSEAPKKKTERPRDELGRPLPWGSENLLVMEDFDAKQLEENHRLGIAHLNAGRWFQAHEAWETCWKQARGTPDEEFYKGLSQLGAGYTHHARGNPHGTHTLLRRGASRIRGYGPEHRGVDVIALLETVEPEAEAAERAEAAGEPLPALRRPRI